MHLNKLVLSIGKKVWDKAIYFYIKLAKSSYCFIMFMLFAVIP